MSTEIPFVRIFGNFPIYTALTSEKDGNKLLKQETKNKLKQKHRYSDTDGSEEKGSGRILGRLGNG